MTIYYHDNSDSFVELTEEQYSAAGEDITALEEQDLVGIIRRLQSEKAANNEKCKSVLVAALLNVETGLGSESALTKNFSLQFAEIKIREVINRLK